MDKTCPTCGAPRDQLDAWTDAETGIRLAVLRCHACDAQWILREHVREKQKP